MRIVAVVQARLRSERLPRKVLADVGGRPVLAHLLAALRCVADLDGIVLAVPAQDTELIAFGQAARVSVFAGDERDVLARYVGAARQAGADAVVRVTADCPLLDPALVEESLRLYRASPCDYLYVEGYPRGVGDAEVIGVPALTRAAAETSKRSRHREHVMTYITEHPERFSVRLRQAPPELHRPELRVCIDEPADLEVVRRLYAQLGQPGEPPHAAEIIRVLDGAPAIVAINRTVRQRS